MAKRIENPDLELMARFDGESAAPLGSLDDEAEAKLAALEGLSEAFRDALGAEIEEATASDPFAAMWERIEHRITTNGATSHAADAGKVADQPSEGLWGQISGWFERYRSQMMTGAVCAVAAAAVVWFIRPPEKSVEYVEVRAANDAPAVVPVRLTSEAAEVESLEVYDGSGIVLTIPSEGDDDSPTTVIWLSPPENSVEGPI